MNAQILNRDFTHPTDGWYQIEAKGEHPNAAAGVVQVIDNEAIKTIANRFNADAQAGKLSHGNEMLIDIEHFKDNPDKETRAYGWLTALQNREDGIYGQIRWTKTGKEAVDGGDYRFFSTEYDRNDAKILNDAKIKRLRPLRLDGLTLTNMNNNKGQKPITNRDMTKCPDCGGDLEKSSEEGKRYCPSCKKNFADASASAASETKTKNRNQTMQKIASAVGLAAEASEDAILAEVTKLKNRGEISPADLTTLQNRKTELEAENKTLLGEQVDALLDAYGVTEEKVRNRLKGVIAGLKNRQERVDALVDFGFKPVEAAKGNETQTQQRKLHNRDTKTPAKNNALGLTEQQLAEKAQTEIEDYKVRNRCSYAEARNAVRRTKPELFGLES